MKKLVIILLMILSLTSCMLMPAEDVYDVEDSIDDIDALEQELDFSELDEIEQDLAELDW